MEGVFLLYYHGSWNLFQVLPLVAAVAAAAFLAGPRALGEVQSRRLAGEMMMVVVVNMDLPLCWKGGVAKCAINE